MQELTKKIVEFTKERDWDQFHSPENLANSWKNSMQYMRGVLSDNGIPNNIGIAIEYNILPKTLNNIIKIII